MLWILLDVVIVLAALAVVGVLALGLWHRLRVLMAAVTSAGDTLAAATDALDAAQTGRAVDAPVRPGQG